MNEKKALMIFVSLLLVMSVLTLVTPVAGEPPERIVGVKVGDWVKYGNFLATWTSNNPNAPEPPLDLIEYNNTEWATNTVQAISGTNITFQAVTHYRNGTETTSILYVDINTGEGNGSFTLISADLSPGESIYNSTEHASNWANETIRLVYADAFRETNVLALTTSEYVPGDVGEPDQVLTFRIEYFWDKATGILAERTGTIVSSTETKEKYLTVAMRSEVMIDTNLWEAALDTTDPTARAGADQTAIVGQVLSFDAGSSSDNEGGWGIASYDWYFGDGTEGTGATITHIFNATATYTVTLIVEDWAGNFDVDTLTVTVQETSSPLSITGVVILVILLIAGLLFWRLKARK